MFPVACSPQNRSWSCSLHAGRSSDCFVSGKRTVRWIAGAATIPGASCAKCTPSSVRWSSSSGSSNWAVGTIPPIVLSKPPRSVGARQDASCLGCSKGTWKPFSPRSSPACRLAVASLRAAPSRLPPNCWLGLPVPSTLVQPPSSDHGATKIARGPGPAGMGGPEEVVVTTLLIRPGRTLQSAPSGALAAAVLSTTCEQASRCVCSGLCSSPGGRFSPAGPSLSGTTVACLHLCSHAGLLCPPFPSFFPAP